MLGWSLSDRTFHFDYIQTNKKYKSALNQHLGSITKNEKTEKIKSIIKIGITNGITYTYYLSKKTKEHSVYK